MGVKKLPSFRDYWSRNPQLNDQYISSIMTFNRFSFIMNHLHINDNDKEPRKGDPCYDKLYKIRPMITCLNETFKNCFKPNKNQSIDEPIVKFKGRSSMKQYNPMKPIKRGFKIWVRADQTAYVCEFQVYTGKVGKTPETNLGGRVVIDLTREIVGGNDRVYFDNFFTSVNLLTSLKQEKIFACGTVRKDRKDLPKNHKPDKDMKRGDCEYKTSPDGLVWLKWMDKKAVYFLSNFHDPLEMVTVKRKEKDGSSTSIRCSKIVRDYNQHMGYVDNADQLKSTYARDRKSKKWWQRIFWHLMDTAVVNAYILYIEQGNRDNLNLKTFRLGLVNALVGASIECKKGRHSKPQARGGRKPQVSINKRQAESKHMPLYDSNRKRCAHCSTKNVEQRSHWKCTICKVPLCLNNVKNCFADYHK
ncbi:piggyBac transposable element-derived protein 4-like [Venturia canescens]|uniref:piggyBac transposable element-derived protein 4-like n=1 Tax=Venturia canescens TaxID=32260 RepID=UPI001C9CCBFA|nr:piggyBac transposable element-derived protein 4-like [Venturia canescens]